MSARDEFSEEATARDVLDELKRLRARPTHPPDGAIDYPAMVSSLEARVRELERSQRGALFLLAILCKRAGGQIIVTPDEFMDVPPWSVLHRFEEPGGRVVYSVITERRQ